MLAESATMSHDQLNNVLRLFAKYRSLLIQNTLLAELGSRVQGGPFAAMEFVTASAEGCLVAKLIGCYERELHPFVESVIAASYEAILNIGCADGYYAVGFARRCPRSKIYAFDINPIAQNACRELAARNGVADRLEVGGLFSPDSFQMFRGKRTLAMIDIEGSELELVTSVPAAELAHLDLIVECHDCFQPSISERLIRHLSESHHVQRIDNELMAAPLPPLFKTFGHLDQLLATWEWRVGPTPWVVAVSKTRGDLLSPGSQDKPRSYKTDP